MSSLAQKRVYQPTMDKTDTKTVFLDCTSIIQTEFYNEWKRINITLSLHCGAVLLLLCLVCKYQHKTTTETQTHLLNSSWLWANAWATRSNRNDLAVNGDAPPPLLLSPMCISSLDISDESGANWSCIRKWKITWINITKKLYCIE